MSPQQRKGLSLLENLAAIALLLGWLILFTGGTLIDTKPYRYAISPEGVWAMERAADVPPESRYVPPNGVPGVLESWVVVLVFFLPLNLALICVTSGVLGAFGSQAKLQTDDDESDSTDNSSPYSSAMLRGFFVYLFLISGLLLMDSNPFADSSPGQYVRLAGFLSLMSFVVNYRPSVFGQLVTWSFQRIQARGGSRDEKPADVSIRRAQTSTEVVTVQSVEQTVSDVTTSGDGPALDLIAPTATPERRPATAEAAKAR